VLHEGPNRILRNLRALPRTRILHDVVRHPPGDLDGIEKVLRAPGFDPRTTAVVEGRLPSALGPAAPGETARLVAQSPRQVEVAVDVRSPALLVLSDAFYPGWRARLDGVETTIFAVNLAFRGVFVPAGRHRVVFEYRPGSVWLGAGVSVAAFAVAAAALIGGRRRRSGRAP
jgi:hypothetical protein